MERGQTMDFNTRVVWPALSFAQPTLLMELNSIHLNTREFETMLLKCAVERFQTESKRKLQGRVRFW